MTRKIIETTLNNLKIGEKGIIKNILHPTSFVRQRLLEMGLTVGTEIQIIRFAPLGDPIEILIRNYRLSLRENEAKSIIVEKDEIE